MMKSGRNTNYKKRLFPIAISLFAISGIIVVVPFVFADEIPVWVKGVANFWVEGNISDEEFGNAIIFLIESDILKLDLLENLKQQVVQLEKEKAYILEHGSLAGFVSDVKTTEEDKVVHISILPGASQQDTGIDYRTCFQSCELKYFSITLLKIEPGTTIVWTNEDSVSHNINSGIQSFSHGKPNEPDGYMASGEILPGESFSFTIDRIGVIRYFDTNYPWIDGTIVSFPVTDSVSLRDVPTEVPEADQYK